MLSNNLWVQQPLHDASALLASRSDREVRVNVQLIDAETGAHLWADQLDRDMYDKFGRAPGG